MQNGNWTAAEPIELTGQRDMGLCTVCGKEFSINNEELGRNCSLEQRIGRDLLRANTVSIIQDGSGFLALGGWSVHFGMEGNENFALRSDDPETRLLPVLRTVNYVPATKNGEIKPFEAIAQNAAGVKKLAVLKADVDRLGMLFALGFKNDDEKTVHVLRNTTLSRMLEYFFSEWLGVLIGKSYSNCYTVFSGGDDLVVIGPWNEIIDFALAMQRKLFLYCGRNPSITISAAVEMLASKSPVSIAVQNAERSLSKAKDKGDLTQDSGRDQLYLFGRSIKWDRAHQIINRARAVSNLRAKEVFSSADLYKMRAWALMFQEYYRNGDNHGLKYASFISYDIGRKMDERTTRENLAQYKDFWLGLRDIENDPFIHYLQVICDFAIFMNRKEGRP
jgi:CRISPR-associated protein Csm1